ncbi:hypothetical protein C8R47DRAFT_1071641 [Mycena vitilis]|nr:hypothetical protein C8R47DRAFT_1071641 [Mycena vitilis]
MYKCRLCPIKPGDLNWMAQKRLSGHVQTSRHVKAIEAKQKRAPKSIHVPKSVPSGSDGISDCRSTDAPLDQYADAYSSDSTASNFPTDPSGHSVVSDVSDQPAPEFDDSPPFEPDHSSPPGWTDSTGQRVYFSAGDIDANRDLLGNGRAPGNPVLGGNIQVYISDSHEDSRGHKQECSDPYAQGSAPALPQCDERHQGRQDRGATLINLVDVSDSD